MCTLVILRRPGHDWPLLLGANRDEMKDRPWDAPARHWDDRPEVVAGRDRLSGGSWLGVNKDGASWCWRRWTMPRRERPRAPWPR